MNAFNKLVQLAAAAAPNNLPAQAVDTNNLPAQAANKPNDLPAKEAVDECTQQQRHNDETEMIMDNIIADKSKVKYVNKNVKMVVFLYR